MADHLFKRSVHEQCLQLLSQRIESLNQAVQIAQQGANAEGKSTAGDKHDTSRAMAQLEVEQVSRQLAEAEKSMAEISKLNPNQSPAIVTHGALVQLGSQHYYICTALGKIEVDGKPVFVLSLQSPLGTLLRGKKAGEVINFQQKNLQIESVN